MLSTNYIPPHGPGVSSPLFPTAQGSPHPSTYTVQRSLHPSPHGPGVTSPLHLQGPEVTSPLPPRPMETIKGWLLGNGGHRKGGPGKVTGQRLCWCEAREKDGSDQGGRGPAPWRGVGACETALRGLRALWRPRSWLGHWVLTGDWWLGGARATCRSGSSWRGLPTCLLGPLRQGLRGQREAGSVL